MTRRTWLDWLLHWLHIRRFEPIFAVGNIGWKHCSEKTMKRIEKQMEPHP